MNRVDAYYDTVKYFRAIWKFLRALPTAPHYASKNDMSLRGYLNLIWVLGKSRKIMDDADERLDCGQCSRLPGGEKPRLMGWNCPEHGLDTWGLRDE